VECPASTWVSGCAPRSALWHKQQGEGASYAALRKAGVPEPPPLRSAQHAWVCQIWHSTINANTLYRLAIEILVWCHVHDIIISIENPANSWLWAALVALALEHSQEAARALGNFRWSFFMHAVMVQQDANIRDGFQHLASMRCWAPHARMTRSFSISSTLKSGSSPIYITSLRGI